jgi:asparagine synthase (glutamine-hydrolysing)
MCGIVGLWHWNDGGGEYPRAIERMLAQVRHRGPDETGCYSDDRVALGTARLSIIDAGGGHQPMLDPERRYCLAYNGEIYNYVELRALLESHGHRFESRSDTEVLLHAWLQWGADALPRLNGMFAFALYDRVQDTLVLARDRFGERPLFYRWSNGRLAFASELKAFLALDDFEFAFDEPALASIFRTWTPLPDATGFRDIRQVPPGSYVTFTPEPHVRRYYELPLDRRYEQTDFETAADETRGRLEASVRLRLRSDVEVGTYLSGGIDSAVVTALAVQCSNHPVRTFSVGFEEREFDEAPAQRIMAERLGTRHHRLLVSNTDIAAAFPAALRHAEVPVFRTAFVPMYLLSREVYAQGIKVVLTGEGADEVFLGYDIFKETKIRSSAANDVDIRRMIAALYPYESHLHGDASPLFALFKQFSGGAGDPFFSHHLRFHNSSFATRLLRHQGDDSLRRLGDWMHAEGADAWPPMARAQWLEFRTLLAGYLLSSQGDRAGMAHSVESRCPFLDPEVVDWASRLPEDFLLSPSGEEKRVLRAAFADLLPPEIATRPKLPYRAPDMQPFREARPDYLESVLSEHELEAAGIFDVRFASKLVKKVLSSDAPASPRESQAFLFLLSTALLDRLFCKREALT